MTVLVAYAHTPEREAALRHGRRLASKDGSDLAVFDLDESSSADDHGIDPTVADGEGESSRWYARASESRSAAGDLLDLAAELDVELIVVGVRRRSPIGKLVLGSNAQQIIIDAHVPVLAVKSEAS